MTGPMFEKAQSFYDKIMSKITDKCTFFKSSKRNSLQEPRSVQRLFNNLETLWPGGCWIRRILAHTRVV